MDKPRPEDMLMKSDGSPQVLTNYNIDYPGHRGNNQYVHF